MIFLVFVASGFISQLYRFITHIMYGKHSQFNGSISVLFQSLYQILLLNIAPHLVVIEICPHLATKSHICACANTCCTCAIGWTKPELMSDISKLSKQTRARMTWERLAFSLHTTTLAHSLQQNTMWIEQLDKGQSERVSWNGTICIYHYENRLYELSECTHCPMCASSYRLYSQRVRNSSKICRLDDSV